MVVGRIVGTLPDDDWRLSLGEDPARPLKGGLKRGQGRRIIVVCRRSPAASRHSDLHYRPDVGTAAYRY